MTVKNKGFTLVELLVCVAIIGVLASAILMSVRGVRRQARMTMCATNLKNLHNAVINFFAEKSYYPAAGSYALHEKVNEGGKIKENYWEYNGWVAWVKNDNKLEAQSHAADFGADKKTAPTENYRYTGTGVGLDKKRDKVKVARVRRSIEEGALFVYTGKSLKCYCCPELEKEGGIRTYSMNKYFKSRLNPSKIRIRPQDISSPSYNPADNSYASRNASDPSWLGCGRDNSHTALFVETAVKKGECGTDGKAGEKDSDDPWYTREDFDDDSVWNYNKSTHQTRTGVETVHKKTDGIGFWHRRVLDKNGKMKDGYSHVVFIDGHVESIRYRTVSQSGDFYRDLGVGEYDPSKYTGTEGQ